MGRPSCFICDAGVTKRDVYMIVGKTSYSQTTFHKKISQLIGEDFLVVVSKDDRLCERCTDQINRYDKLEMEWLEIKSVITWLLSEKYCLSSGGDVECVSEDLKHLKETNVFKNKNCCQRLGIMGKNSSQSEKKEVLPSSKDATKDRKVRSPTTTTQDLKCTTFKSEIFQDCSEGEVLTNSSLLQTRKTNQGIPTCLEDQILKEFKKENDVFDSGCIDIPFDVEPPKNTAEKQVLKFEFITDLNYRIIASENSNVDELSLKSVLPNNTITIDKKNGRLNNEEKSALSFSIGKSNHLAVQKCKQDITNTHPAKKLRPILPKLTSLELKSLYFSSKSQTKNLVNNNGLDNIITKEIEEHKHNSDNSSFDKELGDTFPMNDIKNESIHNKFLSYSCKICKADFDNEDTLKTHVIKHSKNGQLFNCGFCSKLLKTKYSLQNHTALYHLKKYNYHCEKCGKGFTKKFRLDEHLSGNKRPLLVCEVCGNLFNSNSTLWIHRKWHSNPYPYKCKDCGKLFKHSSVLSVHRRRKHTGERPFKCTYCNLTFNVRDVLKRHLMKHTKIYAFNCTTCERGFTTRPKYRSHMAKAHAVFIEKRTIERKDLKMAVYEDVETTIENSKRTELVSDNLAESLERSNMNFNENPENIVEIVLTTSSILSDEQLASIPASWLT